MPQRRETHRCPPQASRHCWPTSALRRLKPDRNGQPGGHGFGATLRQACQIETPPQLPAALKSVAFNWRQNMPVPSVPHRPVAAMAGKPHHRVSSRPTRQRVCLTLLPPCPVRSTHLDAPKQPLATKASVANVPIEQSRTPSDAASSAAGTSPRASITVTVKPALMRSRAVSCPDPPTSRKHRNMNAPGRTAWPLTSAAHREAYHPGPIIAPNTSGRSSQPAATVTARLGDNPPDPLRRLRPRPSRARAAPTRPLVIWPQYRGVC